MTDFALAAASIDRLAQTATDDFIARQAQVGAALTASPKLFRTWYVDNIGSDAPDQPGTRDAPLLTIEEAWRRTPDGGICFTIGCSHRTIAQFVAKPLSMWIHRSEDPASPFAMGFAEVASNRADRAPGLFSAMPLTIALRDTHISRPTIRAGIDLANDRTLFIALGGLAATLYGCLVGPSQGNSFIFNCQGPMHLHHGPSGSVSPSTGQYVENASIINSSNHGWWVPGRPAGSPLHDGVKVFTDLPNGN